MPVLGVDHCRPPWEPAASASFTLHERQPGLNVVGVAVRLGGAQLQSTLVALPGPVKVKSAWAGQAVFGIETLTCAVWPGDRVPLACENVTPLTPPLDADQFRFAWALLLLLSDTTHVQPVLAL